MAQILPAHASGSHEDEHSNWIVSYADMITLLCCFFVIFFKVSENSGTHDEKVKQELIETFTEGEKLTPKGIVSDSREMRALQLLVAMLNIDGSAEDFINRFEKEYKNLSDAEIAKKIVTKKLSKEDRERVNELRKSLANDRHFDIILPDTSLFSPGSVDLTPTAKLELRKIANILNSLDDLVDIEIAGHTDRTLPSAKAAIKNNWGLSAARAGVVAQELIARGVDAKILRSVGYGDSRPLIEERNRQGQDLLQAMQKNRRVEITLKKKNHD